MKKGYFLWLAAILPAVLPVAALDPGKYAVEGPWKLVWHRCSPLPLGKLSETDRKTVPALRALVFYHTRENTTERTLLMLESLREKFAGKMLIAAITPDTDDYAAAFQKKYPDARVRLASDGTLQATPYFMGGSVLYPQAFLLDADGRLLWRGEAVDLDEYAGKALQNRLDVELQAEIAPLSADLQQLLRDGNPRTLLSMVHRICALEPGNATALRIGVYVLESSNQAEEALKLLKTEAAKAPKLTRIRVSALDLLLRHRELRQHLPDILNSLSCEKLHAGERAMLADILMRNFPYDAAVFRWVGTAVNFEPEAGAPVRERAAVYAVKSGYFYAACRLPEAVKYQQLALAEYRRAGDKEGAAGAERKLAFLQQLSK